MPKQEKRLARFLNNPIETRWNEVAVILRYHGFTVEQGEGTSHWVVYNEARPDLDQFTVTVHDNRIGSYYSRRIKELLEAVIDDEE